MSSWKEFAEVAKDGWGLGPGQAIFWKEQDRGPLYVRIYVPLSTLDIDAERVRLSESDEDVIFELESFFDDLVDMFTGMLPEADFKLLSPLPEGYTSPKKLQWEPELHQVFKKKRISKSTMASLWGQKMDYFDEPIIEFEPWGGGGHDPERARLYHQKWVQQMECPFCQHKDWTYTVGCTLKAPEREYYGSARRAIFCPKCERAVDII